MVGDILQPTHLLFILVVALLVLGPKRLPEVGRTLGAGLRDFRQAINGEATSHEEREPRAYVEPEPDPVPPYEPDAAEAESSGFVATTDESAGSDPLAQTETFSAEDPVARTDTFVAEDPQTEPFEPEAAAGVHDDAPETVAAGDDLLPPASSDELEPVAAGDDLLAPAADDDLVPPTAEHGIAPEPAPEPVAAGTGSGFASALAASRQQPADGASAANDE